MQIWQLSSFLDTLLPFWLKPIQKIMNLTNNLSILKLLIINRSLVTDNVIRVWQTLVEPPRYNPEQDPLAVLHLDNWK